LGSKKNIKEAKPLSFTENSVEKDALLPKEDFLKKFSITLKAFESTGINWSTLNEIHNDYLEKQEHLQGVINLIVARFLTDEAKEVGVHSVRSRLKKPDSLIEKIIRKTIETNKKGESLSITIENYGVKINDLVGVRILHVFKNDWLGLHNFILKTWGNKIISKPLAYYRKGDDKMYIAECRKNGCDAKVHPKAYRSIHYVINHNPTLPFNIAEIQVRTVFEDGWSEIDHKLRYSFKKGTKHVLDGYLLVLNRIAGSADELGSMIKNREIEIQQAEYAKQQNKIKKGGKG
jgi:putative GTP pyrophosphokinase